MTIFSSQSVALMPQTSEVADLVKYFAITDSTQNIAR
ncbi:biotin--[acetyl-CoA-carboxylase] ligase, partial [Gardnerella vaginalis]